MVAVVSALTVLVVTINPPLAAPAAIVTFGGTPPTVGLLLDSVTSAPPVGASPFRVTVPVEGVPPLTVEGLSDTPDTVRGLTVNVADCVPAYDPWIVAWVAVFTAFVVIVNVAEVAPAGTVTLEGTVAIVVLLLLSVTTAPPVGATLVRVTVPVEGVPPVTLAGFSVTEVRLGGGKDPITAISARPMFWLDAETVLTVNVIQVTVFEAKEIVSPAPLFGNVPTGTVLPSLKDSVPDVTLSFKFGLS
jgi:hypothetical protein